MFAIEAFRDQLASDQGDTAELIETHISWVILCGEHAWKLKKGLDLGFLDFTSLESRRLACEEEIRLNRRLDEDLYLGVIPIYGPAETPCLNGSGDPIEFAVHMRRFPTGAELPNFVDALAVDQITELADRLISFHREAAIAGAEDPYGEADWVCQPIEANFAAVRSLPHDNAAFDVLDEVERWSRAEHARLRDVFSRRKAAGAVRECHGDLHLGNMFLDHDRIRVFDCIEFNPKYRWIDVLSEIAFLCMDLEERGRRDLAWILLNHYLETTGDYDGMAVFRYYRTYRAMVRCKISGLQWAQQGAAPDAPSLQEHLDYLRLARRYTETTPPFLAITCGLSGSGKSTLTRNLMTELDFIRVRTDVERKRIHGLDPLDRSGKDRDLYSADASDRTYAHVAGLAETLIHCGWSVIVDGAFLTAGRREQLGAVAGESTPFRILFVDSPAEEIRERLRSRLEDGSDVSDADLDVLASQQAVLEPPDDPATVISVHPDIAISEVADALTK
jgi:aminoglycoside phosphotransferase family enzyme/gluconate kinase